VGPGGAGDPARTAPPCAVRGWGRRRPARGLWRAGAPAFRCCPASCLRQLLRSPWDGPARPQPPVPAPARPPPATARSLADAFAAGPGKAQIAAFVGVPEGDVAFVQPSARPLCPAHFIAVDWRAPRILIVVRGTSTWADSEPGGGRGSAARGSAGRKWPRRRPAAGRGALLCAGVAWAEAARGALFQS
jgi:hypothetical protein